MVNLSRLLGVFGAPYEIAYYHDGVTSTPATWFEELIENQTRTIALYTVGVYLALFRLSAVKHAITPKEKLN